MAILVTFWGHFFGPKIAINRSSNWSKKGSKKWSKWPIFRSFLDPFFGHFWTPFLETPLVCISKYTKKYPEGGQKVVKKWSKNGFLAIFVIFGVSLFLGYPKKWHILWGHFLDQLLDPFLSLFEKHTQRTLWMYQRYPRWVQKVVKKGSFEGPKNPDFDQKWRFLDQNPQG